jgi:hypothetical protein
MYCMAALLVIAFFANLFLKPVSAKYHLGKETAPESPSAQGGTAAATAK